MNDKIIVRNSTGKCIKAMAHVTPKTITIKGVELDIEEGDVIYHTNPAGREEVFDVELVEYLNNPNFPEDMHNIRVTCTKRTSLVKSPFGNTNYNLVNSNLAINSSNLEQRSVMGLNLSELEKSYPEAYKKVKELETELQKPERNESKIKSIILWILDKIPDVLIAILGAYLQKT